MAKEPRPLEVDIPRPGADRPVWSRVGIVGVAGFIVGMAWPKVAGVKIGPSVPADLAARAEANASPSAAARASAAASAAASPSGSAAAGGDEPAPASNQELVVVGAGKIVRCSDRKDKKIDDCEKLLFDPIAVKRLRELARCPSAMGASGKMTIGFEVDFGKKQVGVKKAKARASVPSATVAGVIACAAREFGNVSLDEVPHKHRRYTLEYAVPFYPPGKHPEGASEAPGDGEPAAGSTTSEAEASGTAVIAWDTALLRKEPKDGEVVHRIVRGTKVKIVGKQNDWYKIESGSKAGWVYRGAIGL